MAVNITKMAWLGLAALLAAGTAEVRAQERIVVGEPACSLQRLAGREVRRYLYLRTGRLAVLSGDRELRGQTIVVACKGQEPVADPAVRAAAGKLQPQEFVLKTTAGPDGTRTWWIVGGDGQGALYGAYRFAEKLGVRFYLHGDVAGDERLTAIPDMDETGRPLFALRGVNPWGSHPFGFDAWSSDDYKAIFAQLAKMRMNFLGVHCYPEGHPYAEPTVWLGTRGDFDDRGRVTASYPSHYFNTLVKGHWGPMRSGATGEFSFGGSLLFEDDAWAPPVMAGHCPQPQTPQACNDVFNRMGEQFRDAFAFARGLGVKTCVGTETPVIMPASLRERLKQQGKNPDDPAVVREVYEAMFRRIAASHPLDYFWLWTPEGWTWRGNKPEQYSRTVADICLAIEALEKSGAPFRLATSGWVLGPQHDRAALDRDLPKDVPMSAISRQLGWSEVDEAYGRIRARQTWAIPWLESDAQHGLAAMQLFVGRMRRDAADALAYGCQGLMGLHWRTDALGPNVSALAQAAWDQGGWNPAPGRLPGQAAAPRDGPIGGKVANYPGRTIAKSDDAPLYQTCRYDMGGYNLKLPNGRYRVTLKFCEPHFDAADKRIGDFTLQGKTVLAGLDIFARTGKFAALDVTFDGVEVADGWLRLGVTAKVSMPCISAIVAEGPAGTRKVNCGGPAYKDYEADTETSAAKPRYLACDDFYADWAAANFGPAAGPAAAKVFTAIDGRLPISVAGGCPSGSLKADPAPWENVAKAYAFVEELEQVRPLVRGPGNLERFDWWLNSLRYHRSLHEMRCALGRFDALLKARKSDAALTQYKELLALYGQTYRLLLETVNTPGGLAMVVNLENQAQFRPVVVDGPGRRLEAALGRPLGDDAKPPKAYQGRPRLIVPTVRSVVARGEALRLKVIALDNQPVRQLSVFWRPLGKGEFSRIQTEHVARAVYRAALPPAGEDFEYYIEAATAAGGKLVWPTTAPGLTQSVVVLPADAK
ncbi:MAG: Di-glucose binding within endoplasmic reticulum [Planctomycetes bacterium ADurb.Bin126]|nr:MAG: Di-glucose binding within endoplasmic reticulum [Planctomycetes bacterium ADurb.Bin126]HOD81663.1 malectin domain-containing carbohydrate-binding protein [Phycisphaerae bacterium]HQL74795.1 malectin domain-containing carbohydrate-binding protein [Phycisphaerae bacterium]